MKIAGDSIRAFEQTDKHVDPEHLTSSTLSGSTMSGQRFQLEDLCKPTG